MKAPALSCQSDEPEDLDKFKKLLLRTCGHSFENEREQALSAGLCRRMTALHIDNSQVYFALLVRDDEELLRLTELLTVNETYFFREPDHLRLMVDKLLPEFVSARNQIKVRILCAGCSTGEEPYSVAIMLRERYGADCERLFAITAVDIDSTVIAAAKQGIYGKSSFRGMDKKLLGRYFEPHEADRFLISDAVRKQISFEVVNLLGTSYPPGMQMPDIILYRNVSIYFPGPVQREIFCKLAELLAEGGCLLVGASETIHHDIGVLTLVKKDALFFYHKTPRLVFAERRTTSRYAGSDRVTTQPLSAVPVAATKPDPRTIRTGGDQQPAALRRQPQKTAQADVRQRFDTAIELAHSNQHDKALAILDAIIDLDNTFEKAYCLKGSLLLGAARFDEARMVCEGILRRDALCLEAYLMLGMIARQHGDFDDAFKRFREAIYLDASCWLAHFYSAEILFVQQSWNRARSSFETALKILDSGPLKERGQEFFPLSFNAEQFIVICRHKLSLLAAKKS